MYNVSETVLPIYINGQCPIIKTCSDVTLNLSTNTQGDSKSDVFLCFDTKFKSLVYNKLLKEISIFKEYLPDITRKDWSSGLRRSASKHHEYAGYEFESHSRFFFLPIFSHSFHDFHEMKKVSIILLCILTSLIQLYSVITHAH